MPNADAIHVGIVLNTIDAHGHGPFDVVAAAKEVEDLGIGSLWVGDHLAFRAPILEAVVALSAAAAVTRATKLGFAVALPALRGSAWFAKQATSLQALAEGRVILGVGVGGEFRPEWDSVHVPITDRGRRTDAFLASLPQLFSGQPTAIGAPENVRVPALEPSGQVPPVWVGGRSRAALRRAATHADGWLAVFMTAPSVSRAYVEVTRHADELGRPHPACGVSVPVHVSTGRGSRRDEHEIESFLSGCYGRSIDEMGRYVVSGDVEEITSQLVAYVDAGVRTLLLIPTNPDPIGTYPRLAQVRQGLATALAG